MLELSKKTTGIIAMFTERLTRNATPLRARSSRIVFERAIVCNEPRKIGDCRRRRQRVLCNLRAGKVVRKFDPREPLHRHGPHGSWLAPKLL